MIKPFATSLILSLVMAAGSLSGSAHAAVFFTDTTHIRVANVQVEHGDDTSEDPLVVHGRVGERIEYVPSPLNGFPLDNRYGATSFDNDDVGDGNLSDGYYGVVHEGGLNLDLPFPTAPPPLVGSIAIYNGYGNRSDGHYELRDGLFGGALLGAWTVSNTSGDTNDGVDSFWLVFKVPIRTAILTLVAMDMENATASYREIDVFAPVPGDSNADGSVDLQDLNNVRNHFGGSGLGDVDGDRDVDLDDLNAVRNNFGGSIASTVPEPSSLALVACAGGVLAAVRRRCRISQP